MKTTKILKVSMLILLILLISLVSFFGIYTKGTYKLENIVKDYTLGMDLTGTRLVQLEPTQDTTSDDDNVEHTEVTTELNLDLNTVSNEIGNEVLENTVNNTVENTVENQTETVNEEDKYLESKNIIQDRLKALEISEYRVSVDEQTGVITMELPENTLTDEIINNIYLSGEFEILDSETEEVLLNNDDVKSANVAYYNTGTSTAVYVSIKFNSQGAKKLEEISRIYVETEETPEQDNTIENEVVENAVEDTTVENTTDEATAVENTTDETAAEDATSTEVEQETKQVTLKFNGDEYVTTHFSEPMTTGELQLTIGQTSSDMDTIQENLKQASMIAVLIDNGNLPSEYTVGQNQYIKTSLPVDLLPVIIAIAIIIVTTLMVYLIVEYKEDGIVCSILFYGFIATLLLLIRYVDVTITISSMIGILLTIILEYVFLINLCKKKSENNYIESTLLKYIKFLIPAMIFAIVFIFVKTMAISSIGTAVFWGIILFVIYNYIFTKNILKG